MKIAVIGPGALGCLLAASLGAANEIWLLDRDPERARQIGNQGIILDENGKRLNVRVNVSANSSNVPEVDLVLLCVKSASVSSAINAWMSVVTKGRPLLIALQNGIAHLDILPVAMPGRWALGVTAQGATLAGPGVVMHRGNGPTRIGFPSGVTISEEERIQLQRAAAVLSASGIATETTDDILVHVWNKLLINVGINALTAIHDCPNGRLLDSPGILKTMQDAVLEGAAVAEALGIRIDRNPVARTIEVCRATAANVSSMLQDVRRRRKTEIEAINGAVVTKGVKTGVAVPVNEELVRKVKGIEGGFH
ncbi:MAG: 2-dehydropantoate 2-reductase [Proteobacteria bacterium]|nr:2-dehydropantoate 2-reductase [Pseudomonadota bacterium]MBU1739292.1 2-dehydropantoate 2-reductase [Pseudomonadota bacterium]